MTGLGGASATSRRGRGAGSAALVAALALGLAACGSTVDPETMARVNGVGATAPPVTAGDAAAPGDPGAAEVPGAGPAAPVDAGDGSGGGTGPAAPGPGGSGGGAAGPGGGGSAGGSGGGRAAASCDGFKNQTGITDSTITIANVSDLSGPVPGLFESALDATKAYAAYFNATSSICGRKLQVVSLDSRTDAGADQQAYTKACESAFAAVGSMSAFDSGGAGAAQGCGLPDLRSTSVNPERSRCPTCFAAQAVTQNLVQNATPRYFAKKYPQAAGKAAFFWINAGAAPVNAKSFVAGWERNGFKVVYQQPIDVSEFNYAPFVQNMVDKGVRYVQYLGPYQNAVRLAQAMQSQGFKPDVFALDPTGYDQRYIDTGGTAVEGTRVFLNITPFEDTGSVEMRTYRQWLAQVHPGAVPTFFGVFAWSAARLFVEQSLALGGRLTRKSLVDRLRTVDNWTGNGIHSPQHVGSGRTGECWRVLRLQGGRWVIESGRDYRCEGLVDTGVR